MTQLLSTTVRSSLQEKTILLSNIAVIFYKAGSRTGVEDNKFIKFTLSAGTYSIDDFNAKIKIAVLQERQDWEPPQIKDLKLVFSRLVCSTNILKRLSLTTQPYLLAHTKHPLIYHLPQNNYRYTVNKSIELKVR